MSTVPSSVPQPPSAQQVPFERTHHGDTVTDPYAWLADPKDPETIAYLEAENAYLEAMTAGLSDLRSAIFGVFAGALGPYGYPSTRLSR